MQFHFRGDYLPKEEYEIFDKALVTISNVGPVLYTCHKNINGIDFLHTRIDCTTKEKLKEAAKILNDVADSL